MRLRSNDGEARKEVQFKYALAKVELFQRIQPPLPGGVRRLRISIEIELLERLKLRELPGYAGFKCVAHKVELLLSVRLTQLGKLQTLKLSLTHVKRVIGQRELLKRLQLPELGG